MKAGSLQFRVLRLGFLQDGDVGVGVFPEAQLRFTAEVRRGVEGLESVGQSGGSQSASQL